MLVTIGSEVKQIRPGEIIETKIVVNSPYLDRVDKPVVKKVIKKKKIIKAKEDTSSA